MALYNKYRPTNFDMVCGQESTKKILINQVKTGKLSNAYLFTGPAGTGKTTVARIFAAMVNASEGPTINPDMSDPFVAQIMSGKGDSDVLEFDAATSGGIDEIREMKEKAGYVPLQMRKKIWIVDECHRLTSAAWEGLLKLLEEPPPHAIFILCTTDVDKVTETVITRSMCLRFKPITEGEVCTLLKKIAGLEKIACTEDAIKLLAHASKGSLRLALSNLEKVSNMGGEIDEKTVMECIGSTAQKLVRKFVQSIIDKDFTEGMKNSSEVIGSGVDVREFLEEVANLLHVLSICHRVEPEVFGLSKSDGEEVRALRNYLLEKRKELAEKNKIQLINEISALNSMIKVLNNVHKYTIFNMQPQYLANTAWLLMFKEFGQVKT